MSASRWTAADVPDQTGRIAVITGANSGIGYEAAAVLAARGARVTVRLRETVNPDLLLVPATSDIHQDHQVICREAIRAFKHVTVLGYELPMNTITFKHACFIRLNERHLQTKIASLACYESQKFRNYAEETFIRGLARVRGVQSGHEYAEAFEVIRWNWK